MQVNAAKVFVVYNAYCLPRVESSAENPHFYIINDVQIRRKIKKTNKSNITVTVYDTVTSKTSKMAALISVVLGLKYKK